MHNSKPVAVPFEHFHPEFICCFSSCHVKQGAKMIGIVRLIITILSITLYVENAFNSIGGFANFSLQVVGISYLILLLIGVKTNNRIYLLPYIVLEVSLSFIIS